MKTVRALVLTGYGLNCEEETAAACQKAGFSVTILHLNDLTLHRFNLEKYHLLALPGGFSYGDHIASGKVFANKLMFVLGEKLMHFIASGRAVLGICNGFQILVKAGLLPGINLPAPTHRIATPASPNKTASPVPDLPPTLALPQQASLITNPSAQYENRWVTVRANAHNRSFWLKNLKVPFPLPARHLSGRFVGATRQLEKWIQTHNLIALQYTTTTGAPTQAYPANPNGSRLALAALTNAQGNVLGIMPHPEAAFYKELIPQYLRASAETAHRYHPALSKEDGIGMAFFYNAVAYCQKTF